MNTRARITFETDAENNYFGRETDPGILTVTINGSTVPNHSLNLYNGTATLNISLPDKCKVGQIYTYHVELTDASRAEPFKEQFTIAIGSKITKKTHPGGLRADPPGKEEGNIKKLKFTLSPPEVYEITKEQWKDYEMTEEGALRVKVAGEGIYDFFINSDNIHLLNEIKDIKDPNQISLFKAQYKFGMALIGIMALHHYHQDEQAENDEDKGISAKVYELTKIISPIFLPMIHSIGEVNEE